MLVLSNGEYVVVEFVQHEILENPVKVYNFEVEDYHTYFVGEVSVLVHNGCEDDKLTWNEFQHENAGQGKTKAQLSAEYQASKSQDGHYLHRPYLRKDTIEAIKKKMKYNSQGQIYDEIGDKWLDPGTPMDIGHVPPHEFWYERNVAEQKGWTQAEFNEYMNNPEFYAMQDMHDNRSHLLEDKH